MPRLAILVVEDEAIVAMDLTQRLVKLGYTVVGTAMNAADAVQQALALTPDLVLMDIHLQGDVDGIDAAADIRSRLGLPVIFLTAHSDDDTLGRATITEPFGYLVKPVEDRALKIAIDMAAYKHRMETRSRQMERWLATTLSSLGDGIITADLNMRVTYMNRVAEQLTGWSMPDAYSRPVADVLALFRRDTQAPVALPLPQALEDGAIVGRAEPTCLRSRTGVVVSIDDSWAPMRDADDRLTGVIAVFRDVTAQQAAQESSQEAEERRRQFQKIEALGRLAGGMAHEFNNRLTVIMGYSSLLLDRSEPGHPQRDQLERILRTTEQAAALTQQLLAVGRRQVLRPEPVNLNAVVSRASDGLTKLLGDGIRLEVALADDLRNVDVDQVQIEQALINLAANARDAMPQGGTLRVSTENAVLDAADVRQLPDVGVGRYGVLTVTDTGVGMDSLTQQRIFEPFFSTKGVGKGLGLGLATVFGIVKQSGGHIAVESKPGHGSTFRLYLPATASATLLTAPISATDDVPGGTETILLVDDNLEVRTVVGALLRQLGYTVLEAGSGKEALRVSEAHPGPIDLLLTDVAMPEADGEEVARRLLTVRPNLKVLYMSGYSDSAVASHGVLHQGAAVVLHKPFTGPQLLRSVRNALNDRPS